MPSGSLEGGLRTVMVFFRHISSELNVLLCGSLSRPDCKPAMINYKSPLSRYHERIKSRKKMAPAGRAGALLK